MAVSKLGFQMPTSNIRTLSLEEVRKRQKEQEIQRRNAGLHKADGADFFLEYFRYRDKKVSQSVTKMAQVMSKNKVDDLSKESTSNDEKSGKDIIAAIAEEVGVSAEELTITIEKAGGESAELSEALKDVASIISQKDIKEKSHNKMISENDDEVKDSLSSNLSKELTTRAKALDETVQAILSGGIVTGTLPTAEAMQIKSNVFKAIATQKSSESDDFNIIK